MSEVTHDPLCPWFGSTVVECDDCCICDRLSACEERVRESWYEVQSETWVQGYAAALNAAREAVDGLDKYQHGQISAADALANIDVGRAALIETIRRYSAVAVEGATPIAVQKLMYFLQASGEELRLRFVRNHYGPYADNLRAVLRELEGHYLLGFGDGSQRVELGEPIVLLPGAQAAADQLLNDHADTLRRIDRVMDLASGFESATSLELLASVHWIATQPTDGIRSDDDISSEVVRWSNRKARLFTSGQIDKALGALRDGEWIG